MHLNYNKQTVGRLPIGSSEPPERRRLLRRSSRRCGGCAKRAQRYAAAVEAMKATKEKQAVLENHKQ